MGEWPGDLTFKDPRDELKKILQKLNEDEERTVVREFEAARKQKEEEAAKAAERARTQLQVAQTFDLKLRAADLDRVLPDNPALLESWTSNQDLSIERRARILEVMILRGSGDFSPSFSKDVINLGSRFNATLPRIEGGNGPSYQLAVRGALMDGGAAMFDQLSKNHDVLPHPPSGRLPATEWMITMLRASGPMGDYEHRRLLEYWTKGLPPETQGRVMFHLVDAAATAEWDTHTTINGFEGSVGPVGLGLQWNIAPDSHWAIVGRQIDGAVAPGIRGDAAREQAYSNGYQDAKMSKLE